MVADDDFDKYIHANRQSREKNAHIDRDWEAYPPRNFSERCALRFKKIFADPLISLKKTMYGLRGEPYYWYHKQYRRVPTVDQCWDYDVLCRFEADKQVGRDQKLDSYILVLLRDRAEDCMLYEGHEREKCRPFFDTVRENETNFFIKYGEIAPNDPAYNIFMKQKHRLAWERRHGPVGSGMKKKYYRNDGSAYYA